MAPGTSGAAEVETGESETKVARSAVDQNGAKYQEIKDIKSRSVCYGGAHCVQGLASGMLSEVMFVSPVVEPGFFPLRVTA